jgi:hypothetical protein
MNGRVMPGSLEQFTLGALDLFQSDALKPALDRLGELESVRHHTARVGFRKINIYIHAMPPRSRQTVSG